MKPVKTYWTPSKSPKSPVKLKKKQLNLVKPGKTQLISVQPKVNPIKLSVKPIKTL